MISFRHGKGSHLIAAADISGIVVIVLGRVLRILCLLQYKLLVIVFLSLDLGYVHVLIKGLQILVAYGGVAHIVLYKLKILAVYPTGLLKVSLEQLLLFLALFSFVGYRGIHLVGIARYHAFKLSLVVFLYLGFLLRRKGHALSFSYNYRQCVVDKVIEHLILHAAESLLGRNVVKPIHLINIGKIVVIIIVGVYAYVHVAHLQHGIVGIVYRAGAERRRNGQSRKDKGNGLNGSHSSKISFVIRAWAIATHG